MVDFILAQEGPVLSVAYIKSVSVAHDNVLKHLVYFGQYCMLVTSAYL